jgi:leucyl aminopeptidase
MDATSMTLAGPDADDPRALATAAVEGAILASYRFDRFKSKKDGDDDSGKHLEELTVVGDSEIAEAVEAARIGAEAENFARELQDLPSNVVTPSYLSGRAKAIADEHTSVTCEVLEREQVAEKGMGGLVAVSQGTAEAPADRAALRGRRRGRDPGLVGKGVTFDSGGISIKPSAGMQEMKMDMSGAAAVIEAVSASPSSSCRSTSWPSSLHREHAERDGGEARRHHHQLNGKTVEVNNTDAEGRLILADALLLVSSAPIGSSIWRPSPAR